MSAPARGKRQPKPKEQPRQKASERGGQVRSTAEWVSLGLSLAIVGTIAALLVYAHLTRSDEPAVVAVQPRIEDVRLVDGLYYVPVDITNTGGATVETLEVVLTLTGAAEPETATLSMPFLADGESVEAVAGFQQDPAAGELVVTLSYLQP